MTQTLCAYLADRILPADEAQRRVVARNGNSGERFSMRPVNEGTTLGAVRGYAASFYGGQGFVSAERPLGDGDFRKEGTRVLLIFDYTPETQFLRGTAQQITA
jgi:hypothetical protein